MILTSQKLKIADYLLTVKEKNILLSDTERLNDNIMDAAQKLICKAYQSVLKWQKKEAPPFSRLVRSIYNSCMTVLIIGCYLSTRMAVFRYVMVCTPNLTQVTKDSLKALYKSQLDKSRRLSVTMIPVQKQSDSYNCVFFSVAFDADILGGLSHGDSNFDVSRMRIHLTLCLESGKLTVFPRNPKQIRVTNAEFKVLKI